MFLKCLCCICTLISNAGPVRCAQDTRALTESLKICGNATLLIFLGCAQCDHPLTNQPFSEDDVEREIKRLTLSEMFVLCAEAAKVTTVRFMCCGDPPTSVWGVSPEPSYTHGQAAPNVVIAK